jgi:phosphohistidine phosphatase
MRVFLVRHAEAVKGEPDELRELSEKGRAQSRELGKRFAADALRPAAILTSPLVRARETADEIAKATGTPVEADDRLRPGATVMDFRDAIAGRGDPVVVVGHQPDCGQITYALTGEEPPFPTAGVCVLELP